MSAARFLVGDVFERMADMPDGSVDLVVTSPPFLALRSYLPADHPDKAKEIGSEPTPAEYLDTLLRLTAEWGRLLTPHGSIATELGDTYSGSGGAGGDYNEGGLRDGQPRFTGSARQPFGSIAVELGDTYSGARGYGSPDSPNPAYGNGGRFGERWEGRAAKRFKRRDDGWPLAKSLTLIPSLYAASLAYGRNLLTGAESPAGQWRVRNLVAWVRPNPPVGALADKFRPATSYVTVATRARDRWFDLDAVRTPANPANKRPSLLVRKDIGGRNDQVCGPLGEDGQRIISNPAGAPPLDWWEITPVGYSGAHYAVWPAELCKRLIESMCPRRVCVTCGEPARRIVGEAEYVRPNGERGPALRWASGVADGKGAHTAKPDGKRTRVAPTLGWSDCGCPGDHWRPGHVLDPFGGTGTTGLVATGLARNCTLIDIDERNADLARERIGMFLDIDPGRFAFSSAGSAAPTGGSPSTSLVNPPRGVDR